MLFTSLDYIIFFPIVVVLHFALPHRARHAMLLVASYTFYMWWRPAYAVLMAVSTLIDYFAAIGIEQCGARRGRRAWLAVSLAANLGLLFTFKYYNFFRDTVIALAGQSGAPLGFGASSLLLPVGISFYTFQTLSYTIDVYRGRARAERDLVYFALFVSYFPQLVAGPIERPGRLLPQLKAERRVDWSAVAGGLKMMVWGFFKKIVIADRVAALVNTVYADPRGHDGVALLVATFFFGIQIYCDFSGYTDIAIGSAQVMGVHLMRNFKRPYFAASVPEFWQRWHISLSTWFRDYLYIPLGGSRVPRLRWYFNLLVTFLVSGLWHGANWTFVAWGGLHGLAMVASDATSRARGKLAGLAGLAAMPAAHHVLRVLITYVFVNLSWVFFRAASVSDALYVLGHIWGGIPQVLRPAAAARSLAGLGLSSYHFVLALAAIAILAVVEIAQARVGSLRALVAKQPCAVRWALYNAAVMSVLLFGYASVRPEFIYFQF